MSEQSATQPQATGQDTVSSLAMIRTLVVVASLAGLLIVTVQQLTAPIIRENKARALREAVFRVLPEAERVATFRLADDGTLVPLEDENAKGLKFYAGYDAQGALAGVAMEGDGKGYQDVIRLIYGYDPEQEQIVGMNVLESTETPGLGDKIGKDPAFLAQFQSLAAHLNEAGTGLRNEIRAVKGKADDAWEFDAITGATISSNAVADILTKSAQRQLPLVQQNLERLRKGN